MPQKTRVKKTDNIIESLIKSNSFIFKYKSIAKQFKKN